MFMLAVCAGASQISLDGRGDIAFANFSLPRRIRSGKGILMNNFKADEMEMSINMKAARLAWVFSELALAFFCVAGVVSAGELPSVPFVILCVSTVIFCLSKLILSRQMAAGGND